MSSSNYFDDDIYLVHVSLGGIKYCKIHMWFTSGIKSWNSYLCQWKRIPGQIFAVNVLIVLVTLLS